MNKLYKPNGRAVSVNDDSLEYALSLGWKAEKKEKKKEKQTKKEG